jgi:hypothetical protein
MWMSCSSSGGSGADAVDVEETRSLDIVSDRTATELPSGQDLTDTADDTRHEVDGDAGADRAEGDMDLADGADTGEVPLFVRPQVGDPVSAEELLEVTELYLDLLKQTRYFQATNERVHGWPSSDPQGRYWYGSWWSGVQIRKQDGMVTYWHGPTGSDNNGMRSGPILASACYAHSLWGGQEELVRKLVRGFNSWGLAMQRESMPDQRVLMARSAYPESIETEIAGVPVLIDYSENRPGVPDNPEDPKPPAYYIHNPDNPHWGDIWVKSKRSKDDQGHMLQAMALLPGCTGEAGLDWAEDLELMEGLYGEWCRLVEDDGWRIATVDHDWNLYWPQEDLAAYIALANTECKAMLALRLYGRGNEGDLLCGDGLAPLDEEWGIKNDFHQIQRSYHEAAIAVAFYRGRPDLAAELMAGLAWRLDRIFDAREDVTTPYKGPHEKDLAELVVNSAAVGVPLTWREVRFLHDRIREAHASYVTEARMPTYRIFSPDTPDGQYAFSPDAEGFFWRLLGAPLGTCASPYRSAVSMPVLDCERVRSAGPTLFPLSAATRPGAPAVSVGSLQRGHR